MSDIKKARVARLINRLQELKDHSGGEFNPPSWILDKNRCESDGLSPVEQQEWAACVCQQMRESVALKYKIECIERFGRRGEEIVFVSGKTVLQLTRELIKNILIVKIEVPILEQEFQEKHLAVYDFYSRTDQLWFSKYLDDLFIDTAEKLRNRVEPENPTFH